MSFLLPQPGVKIFYRKHQVEFGKLIRLPTKGAYRLGEFEIAVFSFHSSTHKGLASFQGVKKEPAKWIGFFREQIEAAVKDRCTRYGWMEVFDGRQVERFRWDMVL